MADMCVASCEASETPHGFVYCVLDKGHEGPHWDNVDHVVWQVVTSKAIPRVTQALLTPSADLPACRDEDPAHAATSPPATPTRPKPSSEEG